MAGELNVVFAGVGASLYALIRKQSDGKIWNGTTFVTFSAADIATYDVPLTDQGGDYYSADFPSGIANGTLCDVVIYEQAGATPATTDLSLRSYEHVAGSASTSLPSTGGDWYYAGVEAVQDLIGETALIQISNEPNATSATTMNTGRIERVGQMVDALIDARMAARGYVTPMTVDDVAVNALDDDHPTRMLMRDVSAKMVAWKLNEPRMLMSLSSPSARNAPQIDKIMQQHQDTAEQTLRRIAMKTLYVQADKNYATPRPVQVYLPPSTLLPLPVGTISP